MQEALSASGIQTVYLLKCASLLPSIVFRHHRTLQACEHPLTWTDLLQTGSWGRMEAPPAATGMRTTTLQRPWGRALPGLCWLGGCCTPTPTPSPTHFTT